MQPKSLFSYLFKSTLSIVQCKKTQQEQYFPQLLRIFLLQSKDLRSIYPMNCGLRIRHSPLLNLKIIRIKK